MSFAFFKVVSSLPSPLEPNAIYAVRVGAGFDLYVSDMTGVVAHKLNAPSPDDSNLAKTPLRAGAYGDTGVVFHDTSRFIITSSYGKWIKVPALDYNRAGTYTVSFLTDKNVSRIAFYADGSYYDCQVKELSGLKLFYRSFTAQKIQAHMYIQATSGNIYAHKLEVGNISTLSDDGNYIIADILARLDKLEDKP